MTYFESDNVEKDNAKVLKIKQTLSLDISNSQLIDKLGAETTKHSFWVKNNVDLKVQTHILL